MNVIVYMGVQTEREALCQALQAWGALVCADIQIVTWSPDQAPLPSPAPVLFWDLDGDISFPGEEIGGGKESPALLVCASDSGRAIGCYPLHPAAFLKKPIRLDTLWPAMRRCVDRWWSALDRLELLCGGTRRKIPLYDLIWVQSSGQGCLIHTSREHLQARQTLRELEEALPARIFLRCHRSFLVNLCHVRAIEGQFLRMTDGTDIPIGRGNRKAALAASNSLRLLRSGVV